MHRVFSWEARSVKLWQGILILNALILSYNWLGLARRRLSSPRIILLSKKVTYAGIFEGGCNISDGDLKGEWGSQSVTLSLVKGRIMPSYVT